MKTTINNTLLSRNLFFSLVFFITVFFADWYSGNFFMNKSYRAVKFILCVIVPLLTVRYNFRFEKSLKFIGKSTAIIMVCFVAFFLLFNLLKVEPFRFYQVVSVYHIAYALVCLFSVFFAATLIAKKQACACGYEDFYKNFFLGYTPILIMLYILLYFNYREYNLEYVINFIPFKGEIKTLFSEFGLPEIIRSLGNIAFYTTIALTCTRYTKRKPALRGFITAFAICVLTETAQGLFKIGDADIDDIILNGLGALIGALLYKYFIAALRRKEICSE